MNTKIEALIPILSETLLKMEGLKLKEEDKQKASEIGPLNIFFIDMLIRFKENLQAILILLDKSEAVKYTEIDYPIGLIVRSALVDSLRCFYVIAKLDEEFDGVNGYKDLERQKAIKIFFNKDQLPRHEKEMTKLCDLTKGKDDADEQKLHALYTEYLVAFRSAFSEELNEIENQKELKSKTTWGMIDFIVKNDRYSIDGYWLYNYWITYSTYEHYGAITSRLHLNNEFEKDKTENLLHALSYVFHGMQYLFALKQYKEAQEFIEEKNARIANIINQM